MQKRFDTTSLDFAENKQAFIEFLKDYNNKFSDYNFDGSNISHLLDVFATDNIFKSMLAHLSVNETNISTSQLRTNVVARAKDLGYVPHSILAATAYVKLTINNPIGSPIPAFLELPKGTNFTASANGLSLNFTTRESYIASYNQTLNKFIFDNVKIYQGVLKNYYKRADSKIQNQKFEINDNFADLSTLYCKVRSHEASDGYEIFYPWENEINLDENSAVFFTQENRSGNFEIYFGDGVIGKKIENNNVVEFEYVKTDGIDGNGISSFSLSTDIEGNTNITLETLSSSSGGDIKEDIETIRFRAPLWRTTQNRAVTNQDYKSLIERHFANIDSISVWGGQDNKALNLPDFGKVYIAIKPKTNGFLSKEEKTNIISYLKTKNIATVTPVIEDPNYNDLSLEVFFKYNPKVTDSSLSTIKTKVLENIQSYNNTTLNKFDGVLRYSKLLNSIDNADPGIINSFVRIYLQKTIVPKNDSINYFEISFSSPLFITDRKDPILESTEFFLNTEKHYFGDTPTESETERNLIVYKIVDNKRVIINNNAGKIYPAIGKIVIDNFIPDTTDPIILTVIPDSDDIAPKRSEILRINFQNMIITGEIDSIVTRGNSGFDNYQTTSRLK